MDERNSCEGCPQDKTPCIIRICGKSVSAAESDRIAYEKCSLLNYLRVRREKINGQDKKNVG
ncbi:MAG: hypothetical protein LIO53_02020 [Oscillospiraceae bacterium]|nr:hypothetical protein [Oscillospiraceae bacterium]